MKRRKSFQIIVANPCDEPEENMKPTGCGMYCNTCRKEVIDFTNLSDTEVAATFKYKSNICGTFSAEQMDKVFHYEEIIPVKLSTRPLAGLLGLISLFNLQVADGQTKKVKTEIAPDNNKLKGGSETELCIEGRIMEGKPLENVEVSITGTDIICRTDKNGFFTVRLPSSFKEKYVLFVFIYDFKVARRRMAVADIRNEVYTYNIGEFTNDNTAAINPKELIRGGGAAACIRIEPHQELLPNDKKYNVFQRTWRKIKKTRK